MVPEQASIYLAGNNPSLTNEISNSLKQSGLKVTEKGDKVTDYRLLLFDLEQSVDNLSAKILDMLDDLKEYTGKSCLVFSVGSQNSDGNFEKYFTLVRSYLSDRKNNLRLVRSFDLYSTVATPLSGFHTWICQMVRERKVTVPSSEDHHYLPTTIADLTALVLRSLFVANTAGETFTAAGEEVTPLEVAYLTKRGLEKKGLVLDIDLETKSPGQTTGLYDLSVQTQAILNWIPRDGLTQAIDELIDSCLSQPSEETVAPAEKKEIRLERLIIEGKKKHKQEKESLEINLHQFEKKKVTRLALYLLGLLILLISLPPLLGLGSLYLASKETYQSYQLVRQGNEKKAREALNSAVFFKNITSSGFLSVGRIGNLVFKKQLDYANNYILVLGHTQGVLANILDTYSLGNQIYLSLLGKQATEQRASIAALRVNLIGISEKTSQIQLLLDQVRLPLGFENKINLAEVGGQINLLKSQIALSLPLLDLLDKITSNQNTQRYLVLIQDSNELRGAGGFLTGYAILTLDQGRIIDIQVDSSLSLDRLIQGKIEPPGIVKQLLNQQNWSFRDSNLDADFTVNARQASWFYQRFKNQTVDGVLSLNTNVLRFSLDEIGPVKLPGDQTVDAGNFNQLASNATNSQGIDVPTALSKFLAGKLTSGDLSFASAARVLLKVISFNEINFWFSNPSLESLVDLAGLSGKIEAGRCHPQLASSLCREDTLYLNEANLSISKSNYYLKRDISYLAQIADSGEVNYTLTYDYAYPVPAPTNLSQVYKAYYQLFLPFGSSNLTITLDGQQLNEKSLLQTAYNGLTKVEFSSSQSINQPHRLVIRLTSPNKLNLRSPQVAYAFAYLKQPGTFNDNLTIKIHYPSILAPRLMTIPLKQSGPNELVFQASPVSQENIGLLFKNQSL